MTTPKCNVENMTALCEALESGQYPQTTNRLRRGDAFCCAGVACHKSGIGQWRDGDYYISGEREAERYELPKSVIDWLGITRGKGAPCIPVGKVTNDEFKGDRPTAVGMNDVGKSFAQIAAAIRSYYKLPPKADN